MNTYVSYRLLRAVSTVGLVACLCGCGRRDVIPESPAPDAPPALATVNGRVLTEADFQFEVQRRLAAHRALNDPESILKDLVEREVMLQAARASEHMADPALRRERENQELSQWLEHTLQAEKQGIEVSDEELRQAYEATIDEFTRPEMVRLAILYRRSTPKSTAQEITALQAELEKGRAAYAVDPQAARQAGRLQGFGVVAADFSEHTVSRYRGGDLGWLEPAQAKLRWPAAVVHAGMALDLDEISDVLNTDKGLFVVMKTGARPAQVTAFEDAVPSLRRRLIRDRQDAVTKSFHDRLMEGQRIEFDAEQISRLNIPTAPAAAVAHQPPALRPVSDMSPKTRGNPRD